MGLRGGCGIGGEQVDMATSLPPNQQLAAPGRWPVVGEKGPRKSDAPWTVSVGGLVARPRAWSLEELRALPWVERVVDIHCVTRWSKPDARFGGIEMRTLLDACGTLAEARFVSFVARSERDHSTSLPLDDAFRLGALIALDYEGAPLEEIHGGPVRIVTPERYFYKSVKWLERIEVLADDRLGYWEREAGYHNVADPWNEQRYIASEIDRVVLRKALESRVFTGADFRGIDARGRDLAGLDARGALLRNADFREANLTGARFDGANLSNAHLQNAKLGGASFRDADVEGADFREADLRGVDFTGASLFGATFVDASGGSAARIDDAAQLDVASLDGLAPEQRQWIERQETRG